jgi:hydroxymethylpyrimidine/phosphomethylpyrimidine kinase
MNIRYSKERVALLRKRGFRVEHFDRRREPKSVKEEEGSSLEWGVGEVLKTSRRVPDFIYDEGAVGKEPMIRVLGKSPNEVVAKIMKIGK